jgi:hypothetical protein
MSQAVAGIAGGLIAGLSATLDVLFTTGRYLGPGPLLPDCAVMEDHSDTLTVTKHPVQAGANISDHAYKEPAQLRLSWAWSNSSPANALGGNIGSALLHSVIGFGGSEDYIDKIYGELLTLQVSGQVLTVSTGKRLYYNMMITGLHVRTDNTSAYTLPMEIELTEVILVQTQSAQTPSQDQMQDPQQTAPVQSQGQVSATPATPSPSLGQSLLSQVFA